MSQIFMKSDKILLTRGRAGSPIRVSGHGMASADRGTPMPVAATDVLGFLDSMAGKRMIWQWQMLRLLARTKRLEVAAAVRRARWGAHLN